MYHFLRPKTFSYLRSFHEKRMIGGLRNNSQALIQSKNAVFWVIFDLFGQFLVSLVVGGITWQPRPTTSCPKSLNGDYIVNGHRKNNNNK